MTRRILLLLTVGIVLVLALFFIVRGRSSSPASAPVSATPKPNGPSAAQLKRNAQHTQLVSFARAILPDLAQSARLMDHTAAGTAVAHSVGAQLAICNHDSGRVDAVQTNAASVQWPPGGTPARLWRHEIFSVYHLYFGAVVECRNAYDTQDAGQAASAVSDLAAAARKMHREENRARSILK